MSNDRISRVIFEYATRIGGARETDATLQLNADMARDLVGADRCSIWLVDHKSKELWTKVAHGMDELRIALGQGIVGACISQNETILVNDTASDARFLNSAARAGGYVTHNLLAIPLHGADGSVMGAIQLLNKPGGFSQPDVDLLGLAAAYSASALETHMLREQAEAARLLQKEMEIAREVQQRLFPQSPPALDGLDYFAFCRPAKSVGGDYYDFVTMPDGSFLFTLGDVSGKGVGAAVLMASIQASIRSQTVELFDSLALLMENFNKAVYSFSMADKYSTLFCGHLDASMRRLTYVNAGHARPFHYQAADKRIVSLDKGGLPVGLLPMARYEQGEVVLAPGDALLCFSDGLSEATNEAGEMWDERIVKTHFARTATLPAAAQVQALVAAADAFAGAAEQADDMTIMVVRAE
jgi:phosphoserine phosphatase RsbU/P